MPRLLKLFDRFDMKTTWLIPGHTAESSPREREAAAVAGHEIGLHGYSHENPLSMSPDEAVLQRSFEALERVCGAPPTGHVAPWWEFSRVTNELLQRHGIKYDNSLMHDDFHPVLRPGSGTAGRPSTTPSPPPRG